MTVKLQGRKLLLLSTCPFVCLPSNSYKTAAFTHSRYITLIVFHVDYTHLHDMWRITVVIVSSIISVSTLHETVSTNKKKTTRKRVHMYIDTVYISMPSRTPKTKYILRDCWIYILSRHVCALTRPDTPLGYPITRWSHLHVVGPWMKPRPSPWQSVMATEYCTYLYVLLPHLGCHGCGTSCGSFRWWDFGRDGTGWGGERLGWAGAGDEGLEGWWGAEGETVMSLNGSKGKKRDKK